MYKLRADRIAHSAKYYRENKERLLAEQRAARSSNRQYYREQDRALYAKHREKIIAKRRAYRAANPEKVAAYKAVKRAKRMNMLTVGPCQVCGLTPKKVNGRQRIEAHHHKGYAPEHQLDVIWLCRSHHRIANRQ